MKYIAILDKILPWCKKSDFRKKDRFKFLRLCTAFLTHSFVESQLYMTWTDFNLFWNFLPLMELTSLTLFWNISPWQTFKNCTYLVNWNSLKNDFWSFWHKNDLNYQIKRQYLLLNVKITDVILLNHSIVVTSLILLLEFIAWICFFFLKTSVLATLPGPCL